MIYLDCEMNCESKNSIGEIIKIAAHRVAKNRIIDSFEEVIRLSDPNTKLFWHISILTDIFDADLKDARTFNEVLLDFVEWVGNDTIYVYGNNDVPCLKHSIRLNIEQRNKEFKCLNDFVISHIVDISQFISVAKYGHPVRKRLINVAKDLHIRVEKELLHSPNYDAQLLFQVHKKLGYPEELVRL